MKNLFLQYRFPFLLSIILIFLILPGSLVFIENNKYFSINQAFVEWSFDENYISFSASQSRASRGQGTEVFIWNFQEETYHSLGLQTFCFNSKLIPSSQCLNIQNAFSLLKVYFSQDNQALALLFRSFVKDTVYAVLTIDLHTYTMTNYFEWQATDDFIPIIRFTTSNSLHFASITKNELDIELFDVVQSSSQIILSMNKTLPVKEFGPAILSHSLKKMVISNTKDRNISIYDLKTKNITQNLSWNNMTLVPFEWSLDDQQLLVLASNSTQLFYLIYNFQTKTFERSVKTTANPYDISWTPNFEKIFIKEENVVKVWFPSNNTSVLLTKNFDINSINTNGDKVFTGYDDVFEIRNIYTGNIVFVKNLFKFNRDLGMYMVIVGVFSIMIIVFWRLTMKE